MSSDSSLAETRYYTIKAWCLLAAATVAYGCVNGALGTFSFPSQRFLGFFATALLLVAAAGFGISLRVSLAAFVTAVIAALATTDLAIWSLCITLVLACLAYDARGQRLGELLGALAIGGVLIAFAALLLGHLPAAWRVYVDASVALSSWLAGISGAPHNLGPSAAGSGLMLVFTAICAGFLLRARRATDVLLVLVALLIGLVALVGFLSIVVLYWPLWVSGLLEWLDPQAAFQASRRDPAAVALHAPLALLVLLLLPVGLLPAVQLRPLPGRFLSPWPGALLGVVLAWLMTPFFPTAPAKETGVLFYNKGMLDWRVPRNGAFGLQQAGMFGLFPQYLQAAGYRTHRLSKMGRITPQSLAQNQVLVIINPTEMFSAQERQAVWSFVEAGGGLLVMGDHTDLAGMMAPLNTLLAPVDIAYRFDSAFSIRQWRTDYEIFPHPLTRRLDWSNELLRHSTGASLALGGGAFPLVSGKFAFSDYGVRENEANGYLGDYRYQTSELLGDVVIVAGATYGRGRVLVFGDTSAFQNIAIYNSAPFIVDAFDYLSTPASGSIAWPRSLPLLVLLLLVASYLVLARWRPLAVAATALAVVLTAAGLRWWTAAPLRFDHQRLALIEATQLNRFALAHWQRDSIGGLAVNLSRAGYLPLILRSGDWDYLQRARLLISIAPGKTYTAAQRQRLRDFMTGGGGYLVGVGWEERHAVAPFLRELDFTIGPAPLGPVPVRLKTEDPQLIGELRRRPQFHEAWPLAGETPFDEVLYEDLGYVIAAQRRIGAGKAVVIADSYFLMDRALEEENAWWPGNILFVQALLRDLAE
ncbi:hypothetical protein FKG94_01055 [Exilibacterium tricleocarpae]|uniref:DUF4350 domain-containing protein n=1 Tax=Exilibacterium tricleocarpae TaxID=2591008 RepID=A0A545U9T5_9GAMM|nr:DUF4350 domain-containing protein [Exilibacterium tricleocarpae]TQV86173.1 hypothetical protein FKG94_01055 [Exilibacterium tricleocarpae]